jgi:hypothetical protein
LEITTKGEPVLKRLKGKAVPASRIALQEALRRYLPDRSVLDVLWDSNEDVHFQSEDVAHLSVYMTEHLQRFGDYTLKLRPVAPLTHQEKPSPHVLSEDIGDPGDISA